MHRARCCSSLMRCAGYTRPFGSLIRACQLEVHSDCHLWQAGSSTLAVLSPSALTLLLPQPACGPA